ncbi:MAG: tetratricopeptide repeat protein [Candidatus Babeliales bacterium]
MQNRENNGWLLWLSEKQYIALGLAVLTAIIYYPTLWYGFIFDDLPTITNYIHIKEFNPSGLFFSSTRWIPRVLDQITYRFWGIQPFAYRCFNLVVHVACGVLLFFLVYRFAKALYRFPWIQERALIIATLAGGLFLLHPTQTQTATYVIQMRLEGLATFFALLLLTAFIKAVDATNKREYWWWYGASLVLTALAAGTKEVIVVLPFLILLVDWFFIAQGDWGSLKKRWQMHAIYAGLLFGLLAFFGLIRPRYITSLVGAAVHNNRGNILTAAVDQPITFFPFFISQFKVLLHYLFIFIWPFSLCFDYEVKLAQSVFSLDVIVPLIVLGALFAGMCMLWKRDKAHPVTFGIVWFFIAMFPRASIVPSTELICDYKTYMASPGMMFLLALVFAWGFNYIIEQLKPLENKNKLHSMWYMLAGLMFILGCMTFYRNRVWSSEFAFWKDVIEKAPGKARGYNNYAVALMEMGKVDDALQQFEKAVVCDAWYAEPHINMATVWHSRGQRDRAMSHYQRAFEIGEGHPELFHNLGLFHLEDNAFDKAQICFEKAVELRPYYSRALCKLGQLYQRQGKIKEAHNCFGRALKGDAPDQEACILYGMASQELGLFDEAIAVFKSVEKNFPQATFLLGCSYYNKRDYKTACTFFDAAYQRQRDDNVLAYNYALALMHAGNYEHALGLFAKCSQDACNLPFAQLHEVKCLYHVGRKDEAARALDAIIKTTPHKEVKRDAVALKKELKIG